jgi:acetyl esterase/lipase
MCISRATDLAMTGESYTRNARSDFLLERRHLEYWRQLYVGDRDPCDPRVSPLYADLQGLPPLLIQVGDAELLLSDSTCFAERARTAGVDVTLEVWDGGQHDQQIAANLLPEAREAIAHIGEFIDNRLG